MDIKFLTVSSVLLVILGVSAGVYYQPNVQWPTLRSTLGRYDALPRTTKEAKTQGWTPSSNVPDDCYNNGHFNGVRYVEKSNVAIGLLFDRYYNIAGMQILVPQAIFGGNNTYRFDLEPAIQPTIIDGVNYYQVTAYFIPPNQICGASSYPRDLSKVGTGTGLYYQNGTSPDKSIYVPMNRQDAAQAGWTNQNCFPGMGYHNLYHVDEFTIYTCNKFFPALLLFDGEYGKLLGAGFWIMGRTLTTSDRLEKPPADIIAKIMGPSVPRCILDRPTTTLHFFFVEEPWNITCTP